MNRYLLAENIKIRHTFVLKLLILAPLFTIGIAYFLTGQYFTIDNYNWWYTIILPGTVVLICSLITEKEKKMKFRAVMSLPISLKKVWLGKIFLGAELLFLLCSIHFIANTLIVNILNLHSNYEISIINSLLGSVLLFCTFLWQIPMCMFLESKFGFLFTIMVNVLANFIFGVIMAVESFWWICPYSIPSRLMIPVLHILPNGLWAEEGSVTFYEGLMSKNVILPGFLISVLLFTLFTILSTKWFSRQEAV